MFTSSTASASCLLCTRDKKYSNEKAFLTMEWRSVERETHEAKKEVSILLYMKAKVQSRMRVPRATDAAVSCGDRGECSLEKWPLT